jgi:hypothetical protein
MLHVKTYQTQWWSRRATHLSQTLQCLDRIGRLTRQAEQNADGSKPVPPRSESSTIVRKRMSIVGLMIPGSPREHLRKKYQRPPEEAMKKNVVNDETIGAM